MEQLDGWWFTREASSTRHAPIVGLEAGCLALKVVVDTETTGLGHFHGRDDGIVQVALAYRDPDRRRVATWSEVCDPGEQYYRDGRAAGAFRINGMSEGALSEARKAKAVAADLRTRLKELAAEHGAIDLRAYNLGFDRPFLTAVPWKLTGPWGPCLMLEAHRALNPGGKWPKLVEATAMLGVKYPGEGAHNAASDAHAALLVHEALNPAPRSRHVPVKAPAKPTRRAR